MAVNIIPWNTINFECYRDGNRLVGLANVDLSDIEFIGTEIKGAGIAGEFTVPTRGHWQNANITLHFRELFEDATQFAAQGSGHMLSLRGAWEKYDAGTGERIVCGLRVDVRGHTSKLTMGKFEPGETSDTDLELNVDYIKASSLERGSEKVLLELDKFNFVYNIGGTDYLAEVRRMLGR